MSREAINWCIERHRQTNHMYDTYLPYEFHLRMVAQVYESRKYLLDSTLEYSTNLLIVNPDLQISEQKACKLAVWGHDLIEDTRTSYNDVKLMLNEPAADIVYAVTNEKGKNRKERANDKYYEGIRQTKGAVFVKLCDRIANVQYSKMTKSRMFEVYKAENTHFIAQLGWEEEVGHKYTPLFEDLLNLFKES